VRRQKIKPKKSSWKNCSVLAVEYRYRQMIH